VRILVEPKNALIKQYERVFELDGVKLEFSDDALERSPSRPCSVVPVPGLRAILEEVLLDVMYDLPSRTDVGKCVIDPPSSSTGSTRPCPLGDPRRSQPSRRAAS